MARATEMILCRHKVTAMMKKRRRSDRLGEDVGALLGSRNVLESNKTQSNILHDKSTLNSSMFSCLMHNILTFTDINCCLVVDVNSSRSKLLTTQIEEKLTKMLNRDSSLQ